MNNENFVRAVSKRSGITQKDIRVILEAAYEVLIEECKVGGTVKMFPGIIFKSKLEPEHIVKLPVTSEEVTVPAKYRVRLTLTDTFKDRLNED